MKLKSIGGILLLNCLIKLASPMSQIREAMVLIAVAEEVEIQEAEARIFVEEDEATQATSTNQMKEKIQT